MKKSSIIIIILFFISLNNLSSQIIREVEMKLEWEHVFDTSGIEYIYLGNLQKTSDGGYIYVTNKKIVKLKPEGNIEWEYNSDLETYNSSITQTPDGEFICVWRKINWSPYRIDFLYAVKLSSTGKEIWKKEITPSNLVVDNEKIGTPIPTVTSVDKNGNILIFVRNRDRWKEKIPFFIVTLNNKGEFIHNTFLPQTAESYVYSVIKSETGYLFRSSNGNLVQIDTESKLIKEEKEFPWDNIIYNNMYYKKIGNLYIEISMRFDRLSGRIVTARNEDLSIVWEHQYPYTTLIYDIAPSSKGYLLFEYEAKFLSGITSSKFTFMKTNEQGTIEWTSEYNSKYDIQLFDGSVMLEDKGSYLVGAKGAIQKFIPHIHINIEKNQKICKDPVELDCTYDPEEIDTNGEKYEIQWFYKVDKESEYKPIDNSNKQKILADKTGIYKVNVKKRDIDGEAEIQVILLESIELNMQKNITAKEGTTVTLDSGYSENEGYTTTWKSLTTGAIQQGQTLLVHTTDTYLVNVSKTGFCDADKEVTVSFDKDKEPEIKCNNQVIYPNPAAEYLNICLPKGEEWYSYAIYGINGLLLQSHNKSEDRIDVRDLPNGVHILKLKTNLKTHKLKFIKIVK